MTLNIPVSEIMTQQVICVDIDTSLTEVEHIIKKNRIRHVPVVDGDQMKGLISYNDLLRISFADATDDDGEPVETTIYNMFTIDQVMTRNTITINEDTSIAEAAKIFTEKEFHALPVVKDGKLTGMVTTTDIMKYFLNHCS